MNIKALVKNNTVEFSHYRAGNLYYNLRTDGSVLQFPVPVCDTGEGTFLKEDKAIFFMRYLNRAIKDQTLIKQCLAV